MSRITDSIREARAGKADFRSILDEQGVSGEVAEALLADGALGGRSDIDFLRGRQSPKTDPKERALLDALEELETPAAKTSGPKTWSSGSSRYAAPELEGLKAVEQGDAVLRQGDGGALVGEAWDLLDKAGFREAKYGRDQRYGAAMAGKVREFQEANGLESTGAIDRDTLAALREAGRDKPAQAIADRASNPLKRSATDWVVTDGEARKSIADLSRYDQKDLNRIASEMDPKLTSRMLGNLSDSDRAQYQPTIDRLVKAQNGRREALGDVGGAANDIRGQVTSKFGNWGVTDGDARSAIDRLSRMNDRDLAAVTDRLGSDAVSSLLGNLSDTDRRLYAPTISRLHTTQNAPSAHLSR